MESGPVPLHFKDSAIHGTGGFAAGPISQGSLIIEYLGEKIDIAESTRRCSENNEFIFRLNDQCHLDGNVVWNPARFLNHSCAPNAEAHLLEERIWIVASRDIAAGEEITFNYSYDLEDFEEYPCRCGAAKCVGFIIAEEFFPELEKRRARAGNND